VDRNSTSLLRRQIERVRWLHEEDLAAGYGEVYLPEVRERKYPHAAWEFVWQYLLPASRRSIDPRSRKANVSCNAAVWPSEACRIFSW
jgi:hypothetical protein